MPEGILLMELDRSKGFQGYARYGIVRAVHAQEEFLLPPEVLEDWTGLYLTVAGTCHLERSGGIMGVEQPFLVERYPVKRWKPLIGMPLTMSEADLKQWCKEVLEEDGSFDYTPPLFTLEYVVKDPGGLDRHFVLERE